MANIAIFRINYKSDFLLTLESDAGWLTPFCIKFWTGAPSQAYFAGYDGTTYTNCSPVEGEPSKLAVQFDDHNLPIGELKFQIGYHFTVDDFPTTIEDEVLNEASVIIEVDDAPAQVMLDLNGETAPEIEFALPAYANEQQRIENEEQRIENEQARVEAEEARVAAENARVDEFAQLKTESEEATANANAAAQLATEKAALAQQKADYAQTQGDYAKAQGDYAKSQGDIAQADHQRAESDHATATADHTQAASDHSTATADHTQAVSDHTQAAADHTQAGADHTRAESDHTRAESDHEAVEVYVDSLGAFDISAYHATGGVLAKYADLTAAIGTNGANIPEALRKGGMSVKYAQSSDNKYVQYRLMSDDWSTTVADWQGVDDEPTNSSKNLTESGGIYNAIKYNSAAQQALQLTKPLLKFKISMQGSIEDPQYLGSFDFVSGETYLLNFHNGGSEDFVCGTIRLSNGAADTETVFFTDGVKVKAGEDYYICLTPAVSKNYLRVSATDFFPTTLSVSAYKVENTSYVYDNLQNILQNIVSTNKNIAQRLSIVEGGYLNFDTANGQLIITGPMYIVFNGVEKGISSQTLDLNVSTFVALTYDTLTDTVLIKKIENLTDTDIPMASWIKTTDSALVHNIQTSIRYTVDGKDIDYEVKEDISELRKLQSFSYIDGYGINPVGRIVNSNSEKCTGFINVMGMSKVIVSATYPGSNVAFYDENKNAISVLSGTKSKTTIDIPVAAKYMAVGDYKNSTTAECIIIGTDFTLPIYKALDCFITGSIKKGTIIANSDTLDLEKLDTSNPPATPTDSGGWDWQNAFLVEDGRLIYNNSEIQTRLIPIIAGAKYAYTGKFSGTGSIGFYDAKKEFISALAANRFGSTITSCTFISPVNAAYASFNCYKDTVANFSVVCDEDFIDITQFEDKVGTVKELSLTDTLKTNIGNKYLAITEHITGNVTNSEGEKTLISFSTSGNETYYIKYAHSGALNVTLPQKENTYYENNIKQVEFPMSVFNHYLNLYKGSSQLSSILLNGQKRLPLVRTIPAFTIRFMPTEQQSLSNFTNLRLYITSSDGIVNNISIKDGNTVVYTKSISSSDDVPTLYATLKEELAAIEDYDFDMEFGDIEGLNVKDLVATKVEGLPFVTLYSDNCLTTGNVLYDNCPVFVEGQYNDSFEVEVVEHDGTIRIFFEGDMLTSKNIHGSISSVVTSYTDVVIDQMDYEYGYNDICSKRPVIKGWTCHHSATSPSETESFAIGNVLYLENELRKKGWTNISVADVVKYMQTPSHKLPSKSWFLEIDDLGGRDGVNQMLGDQDEYLRQLELFKMKNIHLCFAYIPTGDSELFLKIKNGTATEEEKNTLSTVFSDSMVYRMRGLIETMGANISLHSFIYPTNNVTSSSFDDIIAGLRNSIWWCERLFNTTPTSYVTHGTGNSSPYYRRVLQMYGMQAVGQDNETWYSIGRRQAFYNRNGIYNRIEVDDLSYDS